MDAESLAGDTGAAARPDLERLGVSHGARWPSGGLARHGGAVAAENTPPRLAPPPTPCRPAEGGGGWDGASRAPTLSITRQLC